MDKKITIEIDKSGPGSNTSKSGTQAPVGFDLYKELLALIELLNKSQKNPKCSRAVNLLLVLGFSLILFIFVLIS